MRRVEKKIIRNGQYYINIYGRLHALNDGRFHTFLGNIHLQNYSLYVNLVTHTIVQGFEEYRTYHLHEDTVRFLVNIIKHKPCLDDRRKIIREFCEMIIINHSYT